MTVKTTLSFTDRHHSFLAEKVRDGVFASQSAAVAAALEQMMRDEEEREAALAGMAEAIRARMQTPAADYVEAEAAFAALRARRGGAEGA